MTFVDKILKEYEGTITQHKRGQIFTFFSNQFDIDLAEDMIFKNPKKYKKPDGTFYKVELKPLVDMMSINSEERRKEFEKPGVHTMKMGIGVKHEYALTLPDSVLQEPGIWVYYKPKKFSLLIDGWHRAYARYLKGYKDMEVWLINSLKDIKRICA